MIPEHQNIVCKNKNNLMAEGKVTLGCFIEVVCNGTFPYPKEEQNLTETCSSDSVQ